MFVDVCANLRMWEAKIAGMRDQMVELVQRKSEQTRLVEQMEGVLKIIQTDASNYTCADCRGEGDSVSQPKIILVWCGSNLRIANAKFIQIINTNIQCYTEEGREIEIERARERNEELAAGEEKKNLLKMR
jgi:hypothetical protein